MRSGTFLTFVSRAARFAVYWRCRLGQPCWVGTPLDSREKRLPSLPALRRTTGSGGRNASILHEGAALS